MLVKLRLTLLGCCASLGSTPSSQLSSLREGESPADPASPRAGGIECPTAATPGVAWRVGSGTWPMPRAGLPISRGQDRSGHLMEPTLCGRQMGTVSGWQYSTAEVPKSSCHMGLWTLKEVRSSYRVVSAELDFCRENLGLWSWGDLTFPFLFFFYSFLFSLSFLFFFLFFVVLF